MEQLEQEFVHRDEQRKRRYRERKSKILTRPEERKGQWTSLSQKIRTWMRKAKAKVPIEEDPRSVYMRSEAPKKSKHSYQDEG